MTTSPLIKELLEAGVHFGHQTKRWNPKMRRFIFGERSGIYIIDLQQTESALSRAMEFIAGITARGDTILLVGTKRQAQNILREVAGRCGQPYVVNRWLGGTLTNFSTVRLSVSRLRQLQGWRDNGRFAQLSKKETARLTTELERLEYNLEGITDMERLPSALFVIDPHREAIAVREANRLSIPVVAICDTNCDPDKIVCPIPGNDDAMRAIKFLAERAGDACVAGRRQFEAVRPVAPSPADQRPAPDALTAVEALPHAVVTVEALETEVILPPVIETLEVAPEPVVPKAKRPAARIPRAANKRAPTTHGPE